MKATVQKFKITEEQEILYGKLMKASAIAMGQQPKLPQLNVYEAQNKRFEGRRKEAYDIIKDFGPLTVVELQNFMGFQTIQGAKNIIHKLTRQNKIKRLPNLNKNKYVLYEVK